MAAIRGRRSIRRFLPDPVPAQHLEQILDAARHAPSAGNRQPWRFLVVRSTGTKEELAGRVLASFDSRDDVGEEVKRSVRAHVQGAYAAPVIVFAFVDASVYPELVPYDGALAVANMMLAAHDLGYGSSFQTTFFPDDIVRSLLRVPDRYRLICALPIGKPAECPNAPERADLASLVWYEQYEGKPRSIGCGGKE